MAALFQRLLELGEEPQPALQQLMTSSNILDENTSKEELRAQNLQLQNLLADQKRRYDELMGDSTKLRSEYDTFRSTAYKEKRQLIQQRAEEKRLLDELHRTGSTGQTGEPAMEETEAKLLELQRHLHHAQDEVQKSFQRQREAERSRDAAEAARKEDAQALYEQFEKFKDAMRERNEQLEKQLSESHEALTAAAALETHPFSLRKNGQQPLHGQSEDKETADEDTDVSHTNGTSAARSHSRDGETDESSGETFRPRAQSSVQMQTELQRERALFQRQLEEAKWECVAASRKIAELRAEASTWQAEALQREAALVSAADGHAAKEHELRVETAQSAARAAAAENTLRELRAQQQQQLVAAREERREQAEALDAARRELLQAQRLTAELSAAEAQQQRLIAEREEELFAKEQQRQELRARLREETVARCEAQQRMAELEAKLSASPFDPEEGEGREGGEKGEDEEKEEKAEKEKDEKVKEWPQQQLQARLDDLIAQSARFAFYREAQAARTRQLECRIRQLEAERQQSDAAASVRVELSKPPPLLHQHQEQQQQQQRSTTVGTGTGTLEMLYVAPSERSRQQFVSEAFTTAKKLRLATAFSMRRILLVSLACLMVVIMLINSFGAPNVDRSEAGADAMMRRYTLMQKENNRIMEQLKTCTNRCGHAPLA